MNKTNSKTISYELEARKTLDYVRNFLKTDSCFKSHIAPGSRVVEAALDLAQVYASHAGLDISKEVEELRKHAMNS